MKRILMVGALLLAGCAESRVTSPANDDFDFAAAGRATTSMDALVSGAGMSGVAALGGRMPAELSPVAAAPGIASAGAAGVPALALRLLQSLGADSGPLAVQVIRPAVLGHTYIYDEALHRYVSAPSRTGAPANGVRFILYAVDPVSHEPRANQETGYADLTDQHGAGLAVSLRFQAVVSGKTFLDYAFTLTPTFSGGTLSVAGYLADEHNRLDFRLGASGAGIGEARAAHVTFDLSVASLQFHATGALDALSGGDGGVAHIDVTVTIGSDAIHLVGQSTPAAVNASLSVNGHLFATITGDPRHPTVRGEGGRELVPAEIEALGGFVGMVYGVIEMFEHLLEPAAVLLGISILL